MCLSVNGFLTPRSDQDQVGLWDVCLSEISVVIGASESRLDPVIGSSSFLLPRSIVISNTNLNILLCFQKILF